jgi:hypothetical protein
LQERRGGLGLALREKIIGPADEIVKFGGASRGLLVP